MGALAANPPSLVRRNASSDIIGRYKATAAFYLSAILVRDGTQVDGVKKATGTSGFKGIALGQAEAAQDEVDVLEKGLVETTINATVTAGSEGSLVYANTSGSSDNLEDVTTTSTSNLPIGRIAQVLVTGTQGTNRVVLDIEGDGHVAR